MFTFHVFGVPRRPRYVRVLSLVFSSRDPTVDTQEHSGNGILIITGS